MHLRAARPRVATAAALVIIAGGCDGGEAPPEPEPDPQPRYQQIPTDLCKRLRVEEVAERFGLSMAPSYERTSYYKTEPTHWRESCSFDGRAEDGRFATEFDDFRPGGPVAVEVYHEVAEAQEAYDQYAWSEFEFREDHESGATTAELIGWWDSGISLEWVREMKPVDPLEGDSKVTDLIVQQLIRHENLVVRGSLAAFPPAEGTAEVFALLHDLTRALIDEAVEHLTLTTE
jgi:hypothetical protein